MWAAFRGEARLGCFTAGAGGGLDYAAGPLAATELFSDWSPPNDTLYDITRSSLLNNAQLSTLYSSIGVRGHLELAIRAFSSGAAAPAGVALDLYDPRSQFYASAETAAQADTPFAREPGGGYSMTASTHLFAVARDEALGYERFTTLLRRHLLETSGADNVLVRAVNEAMAAPLPGLRCHVLAAELPVFNPFCVFAKSKGDARGVLQQTQADMLCQLSDDGGPDAGRKGALVLLDFKLLMENSNPRHRVENLKNIRQVCTNAYLLEATCNVSITWGALLYATRRRSPQTLYCLLFPLHSTSDQSAAARKGFDAFTDRVFDLALTNPKGEALPVLYADADHRAVFGKGVPAVAKQIEGLCLWESVSASTRMLEPPGADTFHDGLAADTLARTQLRRLKVKEAFKGALLVFAGVSKSPGAADAPAAAAAPAAPAPQAPSSDDDDEPVPPPQRRRSRRLRADDQAVVGVGGLYDAGEAAAAAAVDEDAYNPPVNDETHAERRDLSERLAEAADQLFDALPAGDKLKLRGRAQELFAHLAESLVLFPAAQTVDGAVPVTPPARLVPADGRPLAAQALIRTAQRALNHAVMRRFVRTRGQRARAEVAPDVTLAEFMGAAPHHARRDLWSSEAVQFADGAVTSVLKDMKDEMERFLERV